MLSELLVQRWSSNLVARNCYRGWLLEPGVGRQSWLRKGGRQNMSSKCGNSSCWRWPMDNLPCKASHETFKVDIVLDFIYFEKNSGPSKSHLNVYHGKNEGLVFEVYFKGNVLTSYKNLKKNKANLVKAYLSNKNSFAKKVLNVLFWNQEGFYLTNFFTHIFYFFSHLDRVSFTCFYLSFMHAHFSASYIFITFISVSCLLLFNSHT